MTIIRGQNRKEINPEEFRDYTKNLRRKISKLEAAMHPDWSILEYEGSAQAYIMLREYEEKLLPQYKREKEAACKELRDFLAMRCF